jgi:hypothetical protein
MSFGKFVNMFQTHFLGICLLLVGASAVHYLLVNGAGSGEVYVNETVRTPQLQEPVVSDQDFTRDTTADSVKASGMAAGQPVEEIPVQIVMAHTETAEGLASMENAVQFPEDEALAVSPTPTPVETDLRLEGNEEMNLQEIKETLQLEGNAEMNVQEIKETLRLEGNAEMNVQEIKETQMNEGVQPMEPLLLTEVQNETSGAAVREADTQLEAANEAEVGVVEEATITGLDADGVVFEVKEDLNNEVSWNRLPITACRGV